MFDKRVIKKAIIVILIVVAIILAIMFIRRTLSRYESKGESTSYVDLAFWIVRESFQTQDFFIGEIQPLPSSVMNVDDLSDEQKDKYIKEVTFSVSNFDGENLTDVPLQYDIIVEATTYMPLEYKIYELIEKEDGTFSKKGCIIEQNIIQDSSGTYLKNITVNSDSNNLKMNLDSENGKAHKQTDYFMLEVKFPSATNDYLTDNDQNYQFADLMDYVKIKIRALQQIQEQKTIDEEV